MGAGSAGWGWGGLSDGRGGVGCHREGQSQCAASGKIISGSGSELKASPPPSKPPAPTTGPLLPGLFTLKKILRDFLERAITESGGPRRSRRLRGQPSPLPPRQEHRVPGSQGCRRPAYPNSSGCPGARSLSSPASRALPGATQGCLCSSRLKGASRQPTPHGSPLPMAPGPRVPVRFGAQTGRTAKEEGPPGDGPLRAVDFSTGNRGIHLGALVSAREQRDQEGFLEEGRVLREAPGEPGVGVNVSKHSRVGLARQTGGELS